MTKRTKFDQAYLSDSVRLAILKKAHSEMLTAAINNAPMFLCSQMKKLVLEKFPPDKYKYTFEQLTETGVFINFFPELMQQKPPHVTSHTQQWWSHDNHNARLCAISDAINLITNKNQTK